MTLSHHWQISQLRLRTEKRLYQSVSSLLCRICDEAGKGNIKLQLLYVLHECCTNAIYIKPCSKMYQQTLTHTYYVCKTTTGLSFPAAPSSGYMLSLSFLLPSLQGIVVQRTTILLHKEEEKQRPTF